MIAFNQVRKKTGVLSRCQARKRDTITNPVRLVTVAGSLRQQSAAWTPRRGASARQLQPLLETPQALKQRLPSMTMVSIGHRPSLRRWHDRQIELRRAQGEVGQLVEAT